MVSFIGGGMRRKPPNCRKSLAHEYVPCVTQGACYTFFSNYMFACFCLFSFPQCRSKTVFGSQWCVGTSCFIYVIAFFSYAGVQCKLHIKRYITVTRREEKLESPEFIHCFQMGSSC